MNGPWLTLKKELGGFSLCFSTVIGIIEAMAGQKEYEVWRRGKERASPFISYMQHLIAAFQYLKGAYRKDGEGLFIRECSDRTRGNGFKWKEGRFRLDIRKKFFTMRVGETLEQVAQRSCGWPLPGSVQGQVGRGFEQPGLVEDVSGDGRRVGTRLSLKVTSNPNHSMILW